MTDDAGAIFDDEDDGELIEWFDDPGLHVQPAVFAATIAGAMAVGALGAVGVLALLGRLRH